MDKIDNLLIRACKSENPSYYKFKKLVGMKCGIYTHQIDSEAIVYWLCKLVDEYEPYQDLYGLLKDLSKSKDYYYGGIFEDCDDEGNARILSRLISRLRMLNRTKLAGYRPPLSFRNWMERQNNKK